MRALGEVPQARVLGPAKPKTTLPVGGVPVDVSNQPKMPPLDRIAQSPISKGIQKVFPGAKLGEAVGTSIAAIQSDVRGDNPEATASIDKSAPGVGAVSADVAKAFALPAGIVAAPATIPGAIGVGAGLGTVEGVSSALERGESASGVVNAGVSGAIVGGATGGILSGAGKLLKNAGESLYKFVIPTSKREARLLQTYKANNSVPERIKAAIVGDSAKAPVTAADTAFKKGLVGTESMLGVQAKRASDNIWKGVIAPELNKSNAQVDMPKFFDELREKIVTNNPELVRQKSLLEALEAMKADYAGVKTVPLEKFQRFKEGWAKFVPEKAYQGKPIGGAYNEVKDGAADLARKTIYQTLGGDVREAYFDYGNLQAIKELGQKAMTGGKFKGGTGGFLSALKDMTLTPIGTVGGRTIYRVGEGIEIAGPAGAMSVVDLIDPMILDTLLSGKEAK